VKGGEDLKARVLAPGSVPVERQPRKVGAGEWVMDVPVKPGQTRFDISYRVAAGQPAAYRGRILHEPGPVRLVVPQGMTVKGEGLNALGVEPQTKAQVFGVAKASFELTLEGTGSLRDAAPAGGGAAAGGEAQEETGPRIVTIPPPGYERQWKTVLGLVLGALILGFWSMYLRGSSAAAPGGRPKA
jgi:hypothetical protein